MFKIEVVENVYNTVYISDEDEQKIKDYIKLNSEEFKYMGNDRKICKAVWDLYYDGDIDIFNGDNVVSDTNVEEINWSGFEKRSAEEILGIE